MVPFDWQAHDSAFVTAHLHYVLFGGFVFPMLAAAYYWLGHFTGRQYSYALGKAAFWLIFVGFHLTFFLMHFVGLLGQPRRIDTYPDGIGWTGYNLLSSVGAFVIAAGIALFIIDIALQFFHAPRTRSPGPADLPLLDWLEGRGEEGAVAALRAMSRGPRPGSVPTAWPSRSRRRERRARPR
jgi:cytochrome c oxidase subunit I+III